MASRGSNCGAHRCNGQTRQTVHTSNSAPEAVDIRAELAALDIHNAVNLTNAVVVGVNGFPGRLHAIPKFFL
jgi:hypothetical protein